LDSPPESEYIVRALCRTISDKVLLAGVAWKRRGERFVMTFDLFKYSDGANVRVRSVPDSRDFELTIYEPMPPAFRYVIPDRIRQRILKDRRWKRAVG
jgi:hypothetical protein